MKNRFIALALTVCITVGLFVGCGKNKVNSEPSISSEVSDITSQTSEESKDESSEVLSETVEEGQINAEYARDFSVSRVFSNDMVVQRGEHIRVWGFAPVSENGKKVSARFKGLFAEALVENGEWCITFTKPLEADKNGAQMKIYTDKKEVIFNDVLVGDVYMVVGQSNVEYSVNTHIANTDAATQGGGKEAISSDSIIRLNRSNNESGGNFTEGGGIGAVDYVYRDCKNTLQWTKTTQADTLNFSALGYYFAKEIVKKTGEKIPVGIIEFGFSGLPLGSFLPNEIADKYQMDKLNTTDKTKHKYLTNATGAPGRMVYNFYMAAFEKYAMAGLIWYQGESDYKAEDAVKFNNVFSALMSYMRSTHNLVNKDFPVFIVEFPSIYQKPANYNGTETWLFMRTGIIRSYMGSIPTILKNSYIAVSNDLWNNRTFPNSLHPPIKYENAQRLADLVNSVVHKNVALDKITGPVFQKAEFSQDGKSVVITFSNVGEGLRTKDGQNAVKGLVGYRSNLLPPRLAIKPVSATITAKNQVTVVFDTDVRVVAYNVNEEDFYGETINLCNSNGCSASAFVTPK